jgi:hypothetical protein
LVKYREGSCGASLPFLKTHAMLKKISLKQWIVGAVIITLLVTIFQVKKCSDDRFSGQKAQLDSTTLALQEMTEKYNKRGQVIDAQDVIITDSKTAITDLGKQLLSLKNKDAKQIKQINALIQIKSSIHKDTTLVSFVDSVKMKHFSDSVENACASVISYYRDSAVELPAHLQVDSLQDKNFQFDATLQKSGLRINSIDFPDSQRIAIAVIRGGFLKKDIRGKRHLFLRRSMRIIVLHTNPYIHIKGMSSVVYQPKKKIAGDLLLLGVGVAAGILLVK